jgi:preprotein translocase subunit SecG
MEAGLLDRYTRVSARAPRRARKGFTVEILQVVLQVLLGLTSLLLTLLILLHKGRGGGLSDMFGGGVTSSLGASGVAERNLNRITVILGLVWVACIVVLGLITKFDAGL